VDTLDDAGGQCAALYPEMGVVEYLEFAADLRAIAKGEQRERIKKVVKICGLEDALRNQPYLLDTVHDSKTVLASLERNPLIAAGGAGILYLAFGAVLLLVAVALIVSLWVSVQRRRSEFAVLRAMGLSRGQVVQLLAFEYAIVAVLGLAAGCYLGRLVGERMLSFLNVDENGERAEPAFLLHTEWLLVAGGGLIVLGVFVAALVFASRLITRTTDAAALRTE
ncbi:MAG TPA: FtsX-like permease family protein, partial [Tepidiformaceae bacterium]|nr:FtsX-like permease family protein [Tepidiformaceae bacterium]